MKQRHNTSTSGDIVDDPLSLPTANPNENVSSLLPLPKKSPSSKVPSSTKSNSSNVGAILKVCAAALGGYYYGKMTGSMDNKNELFDPNSCEPSEAMRKFNALYSFYCQAPLFDMMRTSTDQRTDSRRKKKDDQEATKLRKDDDNDNNHNNNMKVAVLVPDVCEPSDMMKRFDEIYASGSWISGLPMMTKDDFYSNAQWPPKFRRSASGPGSDLGNSTTVNSLDIIRQTIGKYSVTTMVDLPCGDVNWIFDAWETDSLKLYIGLDVVRSVIELNTERLRHHSNKIFRVWDGASCRLPKYKLVSDITTADIQAKSVDLIHSRDVLQHLPQQQGLAFLCNMLTSGARVLIATTYQSHSNQDIQAGEFAHINLHKPPYDLPQGDCVETHPEHEPDFTCVYNLTGIWVKKWTLEKRCRS